MKNRWLTFLTTGALALSASVFSQTTTEIKPLRTINVTAAPKIDTRSFNPQISTSFNKKPKISENPMILPWRKTGTKNSLKAGVSDSKLDHGAQPKITFGGPGFNGGIPPDCDVAVGPRHVVAVVNTVLAFYNKTTGAKTFEQSYDAFFAGIGVTGEVISDPKIIYDPVSKRWFTLIIEVGFATPASKQLVAVSDDEDPNGTWFRYRVDSELTVGNDKFWLDYPGFGVNKDTLVITGNMFGYTSGFAGNLFIVLPKQPFLTGGTATATQFHDPQGSTTKIVTTYDATVNAVYSLGDFNTSSVKVNAITGGATPSPRLFQSFVTVPNITYYGSGVVNGAGGSVLDGFDGRIYNASYRNGSILGAHGIQVSDSDTRQKVRWYDVRTNNWPFGGTPSLRQAGDIVGGTGESLHMPAINMNSRNEISVLYTRTSPGIVADLVFSTRRASDPSGVVGRPTLVARSTANYPFYRWGDYFGVAIDPIDDRTFWGFGMVSTANIWDTFVSSWRIPSNGEGAIAYNAQTASIFSAQGTFVSGTLASVFNADNNLYRVNSSRVAGFGQVTAVEAAYGTNLTPETAQYLGLNLKSAAPTGSTVQVYFYNQVKRAYELVKSYTSTTTVTKIDLAEAQAKLYLAANGQVKVMVRTINPVRSGNMPPTFTLGLDQLQLLGEAKPIN